MTKHIYCIGGANIDRKLKPLQPLQFKTSNPVSSISTFGGVARNVAENLAYWTKHIYLQCVVGNDNDGLRILNHMHHLQVNIDHCVRLDNFSTANYYAILNEDGDLHNAFSDMLIYDHLPIAGFSKSWTQWASKSIVFIDANLPSILIEYAQAVCRKQDLLLCIDPVSVIKARKLPLTLEHVFLLKPNLSEAASLTGLTIQTIDDAIQSGRLLLARGVENVVISLGENGYVIVNEQLQKHFPVVQTNDISDVNGAGDAFIAGILFGIQQNSSIPDACELGAAAAAFTLQSHETVVKSITASQLQAYINNHKIFKDHPYAAIF